MESRTSRSSSPIADRALASDRSAFGASSWWRRFDAAAAALALLSAGYLVLRNPLPGRHDLIGTGLLPDVCMVLLVGAALLPLAVIPRHSRRRSRVGLRSAGWLGAAAMLGMALSRFLLAHHEATSDEVWPPRVAITERADVASLPLIDQAEWALRLALHAAGTASTLDRPPPIPADWPWPSAVVLATRATAAGTEVWSHYPGSDVTCRALLAATGTDSPGTALAPDCSRGAARPPGLGFAAATRSPSRPFPAAEPRGLPWRQHRRDALRTGGVVLPEHGAPRWRTPLHTPVRASASAMADRVLVGGHATGLVAALEVASGAIDWVTHVPNWVHQEPVGNGAVAVVGFGDNKRSFRGHAPSGVAALDLASGQRLWTAFDKSSVMTAPILADSMVLYATAAGLLKKRVLSTGELRGVATLPGGVIMGPPVLHGDTLVVTLDIDMVCAYLVAAMQELWCHELPWLRMVGHSSAAVHEGSVVLSAAATARTLHLGDLGAVRASLVPSLLRSVLFPRYWEIVHAGQVYLALDLATGKERWRSAFFPRRRVVDGHTAGTPTLTADAGVVVLPIADMLVAFDPATGRTRWTAPALSARGPPLVAEEHVMLAGRSGALEVRRLADGALVCTLVRERGWDRAGPALVNRTAVLVDLDGVVEAIPLDDLLTCRGVGARLPAPR